MNCSLCVPPFNTREVRTTGNGYDASWRLIYSTFALDTTPSPGPAYKTYTRRESYRYDPLGRRVWKEMIRDTAQRVCANHDASSECRNEVTRTVWDGANILYDVRMLADTTGDASEGYPSADTFTGSVGYTHAGGIDVPLDLFKGSTVVVPYADWRGTYDVGTCPTTRCQVNQAYFPLANATAFGDGPVLPTGPPNWFGEVIGGQTDGSGYKYMRNRYYDSRSGRFTQEDPIGLAGGLNSYGFAKGDPVGFSDPFGLCPPQSDWRPECGPEPGLEPALSPVDVLAAGIGGGLRAVARTIFGRMLTSSARGGASSLANEEASAGREVLSDQGDRVLSLNRHAESGSSGSAGTHNFAAAGVSFDEVKRAVTQKIGRLSDLRPGQSEGTVNVQGVTVKYSTFTRENGATSVNFWIPPK